jgi:hypothetical protein
MKRKRGHFLSSVICLLTPFLSNHALRITHHVLLFSAFGSLEFGIYLGFGVWDLEFSFLTFAFLLLPFALTLPLYPFTSLPPALFPRHA